jgi:hypothetical protein
MTTESPKKPGRALRDAMKAMDCFYSAHPETFSCMMDDGTRRMVHNAAPGKLVRSELSDLTTQFTNNGKA